MTVGKLQGRGGGNAGSSAGATLAGEGEEEAVVLFKSTPAYPRKAVKRRQEGWVKIAFTITSEGTVVDPKVVASKPRRVFDRAALKAIRKWRFKPKTRDGSPVSRRAVQVIEFTLGKG